MTSDLSKTGILLLSHGSRLDQGKKVIEAYTQMYKEEFPEAIVEYGFIPKLLGIENDFDESEISGGHHEHHHDHGHHHHHHHHHDHDHDDEETFDFDGEIVLADPLGIDTRLYEIIKDRVSQNL